jgi:peptidoglycan/xylan/chitin deacetylase (PgdA/CDA1 family)
MPATFFLVPSFLARERTSWWETLAAAFQHAKSASLDWQGQFFTLTGPGTRSAFDIVSTQLKRLDTARREAAVSELVDLLEPSPHPPVPDLFMDWDDARQLVSQGAAVGSHSRDHAILANEAPDVQRENLADARRQLQDQLDLPIDLLAYPNGTKDDFDAASVNAAQHAGYRCGVTTIPGRNSASTSFYRLRRHVLFPERGRLGFKRVAKRTVLDSLFGAGTRA